MTREDAKKTIEECEGVETCSTRLRLIDVIYDSFELRNCGNCAIYSEQDICMVKKFPYDIDESEFSCNKWRAR